MALFVPELTQTGGYGSNKKAEASILFLSLLLLLLLEICVPTAYAQVYQALLPTANETSCFRNDGDPLATPSCQVPDDFNMTELQLLLDQTNSTLQKECSKLDYDFIWHYEVIWEQGKHADAMATLQEGSFECNMARQIYHLCYWCLPESDPDWDRRYEFCFLEGDICALPNPNDTERMTLSAVDINRTCDDLREIFYVDVTWPATLELCKRSEAAVYACDFYCVDGHRNPEWQGGTPTNESCWTFEDPPDCGTNVDFQHPPEDLDVQKECTDLGEFLVDGWYNANRWTHVYAFSSIMADHDNCTRFRRAYPYCQTCHPKQVGDEDFCLYENVCRDDVGSRKPVVKDPNVNMRDTCAELEQLMQVENGKPLTADLCYRAEMSLHACPFWCDAPYLGAVSKAQKWTLVGLARASALLSFLGAVYILWDVLSVRKNRQTVYHQLLLAMAVFDIVTAVAWGFSTAALPLDEAWRIVGVRGNEATCTAQAFWIQLGFTSVFYNTSLAAYYVLVIVRRWREDDLKKIRPFLHAGPLVVGLGLACAVVPYADWTGYGCHFLPPPDGERWMSIVFVALPVGTSIFAITLGMAYVYWEVRKNARASRKWSFGVGASSKLETQVFWQSLLYACSFYVSWPILLAVYLDSVDTRANAFAFTATVSFLAPLQGFSNFLVYIRPKLIKEVTTKVKNLRASMTRSNSSGARFSRKSDSSARVASEQTETLTSRASTFPSVVALDSDKVNDDHVYNMDPSARIALQPPKQDDGEGIDHAEISS